MGFIRLFFEPLFPQHRDFTPVPDDWPPDGSLHFIECGSWTQKSVPNTHIQYEFSSNLGEDDHRIEPLSMEIMKRFCDSRWTLTRVLSSRKWPKKMKYPPERFTVRYRRFLEHIGSSASVHAPDEKTLFLLSDGFDPVVFWAYRDLDTADYGFLAAYVLPGDLNTTNAKDAAEDVAAGQYDVRFDFSDCGPCALYITLNPKTVDANTIQRIIESICKEHQILFQNPPQL